MKLINFEKIYLINAIIGFLTFLVTLPIAISHFCNNSIVFSELVPSLTISSLTAWFSFSVYSKGRYTRYRYSILNSKKLFITLVINICAILIIIS